MFQQNLPESYTLVKACSKSHFPLPLTTLSFTRKHRQKFSFHRYATNVCEDNFFRNFPLEMSALLSAHKFSDLKDGEREEERGFTKALAIWKA